MRPTRTLRALSALCLLALQQPAPAWAKGSELDASTRVFPYNGTLEYNGASYSGTADLQITVTDNASCSFTETFNDVTVYNGRFALNIGSQTSGGVASCVFNATAVYIKVAVRNGTSTGSYTSLNGSQRIRPVPYAYWTAEGADLPVDGNLQVAGAANVTGTLRVNGSATRVAIEGPDVLLGTKDGITGSDGTQYALSHSVTTDQLLVNSQGNFTGGTWIVGNTAVESGLTVSGNATFNKTLTANNTPGLVTSGGTNGTANTGAHSDHNHTYSCPGSPIATVNSNKTKLCVYKWSSGSAPKWPTAADGCWTNYGAELCSANQLRNACHAAGLNIDAYYWLRDRMADDYGMVTNGSNCDNFDASKPWDNGYNGGYCCIEEHSF